jgi:hypothetical protein
VRTLCGEGTFSAALQASSSATCVRCDPDEACPAGSTEARALPCIPPRFFAPPAGFNATSELLAYSEKLGFATLAFFSACACAAPGFSLSPGSYQRVIRLNANNCVQDAPLPASNCAWGWNASCEPCPTGATCPGGKVLHPQRGFWAPSLTGTSRPSELLTCRSPAAERCPGNGSDCGAGYKAGGKECVPCADGYFSKAGACVPCASWNSVLAEAVPVAKFAGGLLGFGCAMLLFAGVQRWRRDGGEWAALFQGCGCWRRRRWEKCPPLRGPQGVLFPVLKLLLWLFSSGQGAASLFSQALNEPKVKAALPPDSLLLSSYNSLAALQFSGATAAPECLSKNAPPFPGLWGTLAAATALLLAMLLALCACRRWRVLSRCVLGAAAAAFAAAYGAFVVSALAAFVCAPPRSMELQEYVSTDSDGTALGANMSLQGLRDELKANPASANGRLTVNVSVLIDDQYKVCGEGQHKYAYWGSVALLALLAAVPLVALLLPLLAAWCPDRRCRRGGGIPVVARSVGHTGGEGSNGESVDGGFTGGDGATVPATAAAAAAPEPLRPPWAPFFGALVDPALEPWAAWFSYANLALTFAVNFGVAFSRQFALGEKLEAYTGVQCAIIVVYVLGAATLFLAQPYVSRERWRNHVTALFFLLTALTASTNTALLRDGKSMGQDWAASLGALPLAMGAFTLACLFYSWRRALLAPDEKKKVWAVIEALSGAASVQAALDALALLRPEAPPPPPPTPPPTPPPELHDPDDDWASVTDADGDRFFRNVATGELKWWRPSGRFAPGLMDAGAGLPEEPVWVDRETGAVSFTNPLTGALAPHAGAEGGGGAAWEAEAGAQRRRLARERGERALAAARAREERALRAFEAARGDLAAFAEAEEDGGEALLAALDARGRELKAAMAAARAAEASLPPP